MFIRSKIGPLVLIQLTIIPIFLWLRDSTLDSLLGWGQLTAIIGATLLCLNFVLSSRFRPIEGLFAGLNRMYIVHAVVGSLAFSFLIAHPIFLMLSYLQISLLAAFKLITPSITEYAELLGIIALLLMIFLIVLTLYVKLEYDLWKQTHRFMGLVLLLGCLHAFLIGSTLTYNIPLKIYMLFMFALGFAGFLYKQFSALFGIDVYKFKITSVNFLNDVVSVSLLAADNKIFKHKPGQFAFFRFHHKGVLKQWHPFSISSVSSSTRTLSLDVKSLGDYTETLRLLTEGTDVDVEGPFGRFSYQYYKNKKNIWIAGGIGVTPFLGMAKSLTAQDNMNVIFYYSVKNLAEAIHTDELQKVFTNLSQRFILYDTSASGFLTAEKIVAEVTDYKDHEIFICGPPAMMDNLRRQFIALGVKKRSIHTEEFSLN